MDKQKKAFKMTDSEVEKKEETPWFVPVFKAKKDHVIIQNDFKLKIEAGEEYKEIPIMYEQTLKVERII